MNKLFKYCKRHPYLGLILAIALVFVPASFSVRADVSRSREAKFCFLC